MTVSQMTNLRVMIVDDEAHARDRLRRLLAQEPAVEVVAECASGADAVAANAKARPDLLLLDVQMPEMNGFGVIRAIPRDELPLIVFVTAFDSHAIEAFDVHAVDYVLKPVEAPRLREAIGRARQRLEQESAARNQDALIDVAAREQHGNAVADGEGGELQPETKSGPRDRFLIRHDGNLHPVLAADILWVEAHGNYARINLPDGRAYMVRTTMSAMEERLDPAQFARIHRSAIVNLDAVRELQPWFGGDYVVILKNGARLKASRTYKTRLDHWILG
jgi:two-component system, LytTR family, response regulator